MASMVSIAHYNYKNNSFKNSRGFVLLEVLLAWGLATGIMLGILLWANQTLSDVHQAYWRTVAQQRLQSMLERLQANQSAASRDKEFNLWNQKNKTLLPDAQGRYDCNAQTRICHVYIQWQFHQLYHLDMQMLI